MQTCNVPRKAGDLTLNIILLESAMENPYCSSQQFQKVAIIAMEQIAAVAKIVETAVFVNKVKKTVLKKYYRSTGFAEFAKQGMERWPSGGLLLPTV